MKNKDFDSFNNDRINALRKRIDELKDWKDFHVELFLKAICTGVSKKKR